MKKLFRKAVSVLGSVALVGATISTAAAATYPAPFDGGDYAVVYGGALDADAANTIATGLPSLGGSTTTIEGGESYTLEKTSDKFNLGDSMNTFATTLNDDDLEEFLADGVYKDNDRDEFDYKQKITTKATQLTYFKDSDYNAKEPTLGFHYNSNADVLDYTLTIQDGGVPAIDLPQTTLPLMGNGYYVLSADNSSDEIVLLDSSATTIVSEGVPVTVNVGGTDYTVEALVEDGWVKYTVNGETTDKLSDGDDYELEDGAVIASIEELFSSKDTGVSKAEFTIGNGKLTLRDGDEVEINDEAVSGVTVALSGGAFGNVLNSVVISWAVDDDVFLTEDTPETVLPGFGTMKVIYGGLDYPAETEETTFDSGDPLSLNTELKEGSLSLPLAYMNTSDMIPNLGADAEDELIVNGTTAMSNNFTEGQRFVVSYVSSDEEDFATYVYEVQNIANSSGTTTVKLNSLVSGGSDVDLPYDDSTGGDFGGDGVEIAGEILLNVTSAHDPTGTADWAVITASAAASATVSVNKIYTVGGLEVTLPQTGLFRNTSTDALLQVTDFTVDLKEIDEDGKVAQTDMGNMTVNISADATEDAVEALSLAFSGQTEGSHYQQRESLTDNVYNGYFYSEIASMWEHDRSADLNELKFMTPSTEVKATVQIASGTASVSSSSGQKTFMDSESGYSGKNLVVVGGSCVNSVAATLYGGAHCGDDWVGATGSGPGTGVIESFDHGGKVATVVAGYEQADTSVAATYLNNAGNDVLTDAGVKYKVQTSTETAVKVS